MKTDNNFVRSGHERIANDNYQTVDPRCVQALIETLPNAFHDTFITDVCSPSGSGIVDYFSTIGWHSSGIPDAFGRVDNYGWVVSNPPYERSKVDKIINRQIERIDSKEVHSVAMLLRTGFDHAKTRVNMFEFNEHYAGQIKMLFRPVWFLDTETTPIHNYVWHIWSNNIFVRHDFPRVWYW